MLVFFREKLVFFATPKTASTSIEMALGPAADMRISRAPNAKHTPYRKYKRLLEPFVLTLTDGELDCMCLLREPVDWLGSWWRYRSRDALAGTANSTAAISFDAFVEAYLSDDPPAYARVGSQGRFMTDKDGAVGMTHIFRFEDIDKAVGFLQGRLGKQFALGTHNPSPPGAVSLSPALRQELVAAHPIDFDLYERLTPPA
ncbi:MAG: gamma-glutamyl kinase [Pseudomonadota bacterium]